MTSSQPAIPRSSSSCAGLTMEVSVAASRTSSRPSIAMPRSARPDCTWTRVVPRALFAERLLLVGKGVTEGACGLREFGSGLGGRTTKSKQAFIDALSIIPMGNKVGQWAAHLLATPGKELCTKLAILRDSDSDLPFDSARDVPKWAAEHDPSIVRVFISHPTLEPAITPGNEDLVAVAQQAVDPAHPLAEVTVDNVRSYFASRRAQKDGEEAVKEGRGARRKAEFALELAAALREANEEDREAGGGLSLVTVPDHLEELFDFLYPTAPNSSSHLTSDEAAMEPPEWLAPDNIWDELPEDVDWDDELDAPGFWPDDEPIEAEHEFEFEAGNGEADESHTWDDAPRPHPMQTNRTGEHRPGGWPTQPVPGARPQGQDNA
uniref:Uncharacterized protein n=1 Tax=Streptomyces sp. WT6 TaxID=1486372 RepID=A0A023PZQ9_9ACTN|nr:hypothetical protein wt6.5c [Streptomyces sp. WT6]